MKRKRGGVGKPIQKGQILNPIGANAHNKEKKAIKKLTEDELVDSMTYVLQGGKLGEWLSAVVEKGIERGDMSALNALLDRVVGKVKDKVHMTVAKEMTDEELIAEARELTKKLENLP